MTAAPSARSLLSLAIAAALAAAAAACARATGEESARATVPAHLPRPDTLAGTGNAASRSPADVAPHAAGAPLHGGATPEGTSPEGRGPLHGGATPEGTSPEGRGPLHGGASSEGRGPLHADLDPGSALELAASSRCASDAECGYDPTTERCAADPRLNRQPPLKDQGIVCYCTAGACALLRALPVPCEGEHDCTVAHEPRPHPARATPERPREKGRPCRDFTLSATCERTNLCTLRRHTCPAR